MISLDLLNHDSKPMLFSRTACKSKQLDTCAFPLRFLYILNASTWNILQLFTSQGRMLHLESFWMMEIGTTKNHDFPPNKFFVLLTTNNIWATGSRVRRLLDYRRRRLLTSIHSTYSSYMFQSTNWNKQSVQFSELLLVPSLKKKYQSHIDIYKLTYKGRVHKISGQADWKGPLPLPAWPKLYVKIVINYKTAK